MMPTSTAELLLGESQPMRVLRQQITKVAVTDLPVLIEGPTGVGKELVARALHIEGRRNGELIAINVAALAETLFEDALFGHVRGAFTGAVGESAGFVAEANGGTLFLDEIGALGPAAQPKLLRVLESKQYRPVGARVDRVSDFRLVSASNTPLHQSVASGAFRADLHQRVASVILRVPTLRERTKDIPMLARHFATRFAARYERRVTIDESAIASLLRYSWPGNVRELKAVVEVAIAFAEFQEVRKLDIDRVIDVRVADAVIGSAALEQRQALLSALDRHNGDTVGVAGELGVNRATVYRWMHDLEIRAPRRSSASDTNRGQHPA